MTTIHDAGVQLSRDKQEEMVLAKVPDQIGEEPCYVIEYSSKLSQQFHGLEDPVLEDLLTICEQKNRRLNITGALYYFKYNNRFYQRLEGKQEAVEKLYKKIQQDPRHQDVRLERSRPGRRQFTNWGMLQVPYLEKQSVVLANGNPDTIFYMTIEAQNMSDKEAQKLANQMKQP